MDNCGRKSISISWCHENVLEIPVKQLRVNWDFNVSDFVSRMLTGNVVEVRNE